MGEIFFKCLTFLLIGIITYYIVPFLKDKKLYNSVVIAVQAAEQIYKGSGMGKQKFEYVKNWVQKTFNVNDEDLKNIIESAVYELNQDKSEGE